jgi:hypothetical protein
MRKSRPTRVVKPYKNARRGTLDKNNSRQDITLESLFVLCIFFNPKDNYYVGVDG